MEGNVTIGGGAVELLLAAAFKVKSGNPDLLIRGDLCTMAAQKAFLLQNGFELGQYDVYPTMTTEADFIKMLRLFWETKFCGWWANYQDELVESGVCTRDEIRQAFGTSIV